jgi:EmrB/QacA subfamily drug resistance transporter
MYVQGGQGIFYARFMVMIPLHSATGRWLITAAVLSSSMAFIDATALNVVLPALQQALGAGGTELFWVLNAYLLMLAALTLVGGVLGDRLGRKRVYMAGILIFTIGSLACGCSGSVGVLVACRVVQGAGGALMIPGSLSLISASFGEAERGKAIGTWGMFTTTVTVGGPILGGLLADAGLWREIFFINLPLAVIAILILWKKVPESKDEGASKALDIWGAVTVAMGLALLTFGCLRIPAAGWRDVTVLAPLVGGVVLLAVFVRIERRGSDPMMPLSLFGNRVFSSVNALTFFLYAGLGTTLLFMSLDMVQVQGYSQLQAGLSFLPFTLLMIGLSRPAGAWADRRGPRVLLIVGPLLTGTGTLLMSFVGQVHRLSDYWVSFFPGFMVFGLGMSLTVVPLTSAVMGSVGPRFAGVASGVNNAVSRVAGVFANAVFGALAVVLFTAAVAGRMDGLGLDARDRQLVMAETSKLGDAKVPEEVRRGSMPTGANEMGPAERSWLSGADGGVARQVEEVYKEGFVGVYAIVLRISAGLAFAGALIAVVFVKKGPIN